VIYCIFKPTFTDINLNEIICNTVMKNICIMNASTEKNKLRYDGKEIITCILTFDDDKPIFYKLNVGDHYINLKPYLYNYLYNLYSSYTELLHRFYKYHATSPDRIGSTVEYVISHIEEYTNIPRYITDSLNMIKSEISLAQENIKPILSKSYIENENNIFTDRLNNELKKSIDDFIGINKVIPNW
jgi:hypothetical protein